MDKHNGASVTSFVTSITTITEVNGRGDPLVTGDYAVVVALAFSPTIAATVAYQIHR